MKRQVDPKKIEQLLNRIRHLDDGRLERGGEKEIVGLLERAKDESAGKSKEIAEIGKETLNWFIKDKKWMLGFFDEILKLAQEYGEKIYCWNCQGEPVPGVSGLFQYVFWYSALRYLQTVRRRLGSGPSTSKKFRRASYFSGE